MKGFALFHFKFLVCELHIGSIRRPYKDFVNYGDQTRISTQTGSIGEGEGTKQLICIWQKKAMNFSAVTHR
jgi:hypothetical protein